MAEGIDVSKWQGDVGWLSVKNAGIDFAIARSTIGRSTKDDLFAQNYTRMRDRGLVPGAYHLVAGDSSGADQAANWKDSLDRVGFDKGLLVLDVEGWSGTLNGLEAGTIKATEYLCDWVRRTYGRTPIIYTGVYWRENLKQHPNNFGSQLWLSYYGTNDPQNYVPSAWDTWKVWQYTSTGTVAGVSGDVDRNKSKGTLDSLKRLAGWEWDELATEAEVKSAVQSVVADEVAKAITALKASDTAAATRVINDVKAAVDAATTAQVSKTDEVMVKLAEVLTVLANSASDTDNSELVALVNDLHKHVCTRTDLHM